MKQNRITQAKLAGTLGVKQPSVCNWLKGNTRPSLELAVQISRITKGKVSVDSWVRETEKPKAEEKA